MNGDRGPQQSVAVAALEDGTILAGSCGIWRSTDAGMVDYFEPTGGDLLVDPSNSRHLWAARFDGVWQSLDGGVTWRQRSKGLRGAAALSLFINPHQPGELEVATSEGLFQTTLP